MITEKDLQEAIAECVGKRKPDASTCQKLAAFYIIKNELYPSKERTMPYYGAYMESGKEQTENTIDYDSGSDFSRLINGRKANEVWAIMDELMDALTAINPRLYNSVMRKLG